MKHTIEGNETAFPIIKRDTQIRIDAFRSAYKLTELGKKELSQMESELKRLSELESDLQQLEGRRWISVEDRLPENIGNYLCVTNDDKWAICHINAIGDWSLCPDPEFYGDMGIKSRKVTHWMPLPTAPELTQNK